jgi:hypothetical protein
LASALEDDGQMPYEDNIQLCLSYKRQTTGYYPEAIDFSFQSTSLLYLPTCHVILD